jgi:elongation factor G
MGECHSKTELKVRLLGLGHLIAEECLRLQTTASGLGDGSPAASLLRSSASELAFQVVQREQQRGGAAVRAVMGVVGSAPLVDESKSLTGGEGAYTMELSHYDPVPPRKQQELAQAFKRTDD